MSIRKLSAALAAATLVVSPVAAQAASTERAGAPTEEANELGRSFVWIAIAIGVVIGLILLLDDDKDSVSA